VESIRDKILPAPCMNVLSRKFQGYWNDTYFEDALEAKCGPLPPHALAEETPLVNPVYRSDGLGIPLTDYLASFDVDRLLRITVEKAFAIGVEWPSGHRDTNLLMYYLMTDIQQRSVCNSTDCRVFRAIVEQTHYRFTMMILKGKGPNKFDFLLPMDLLVEEVKVLAKAVAMSFPTIVAPVSTAEPPVRTGCGWFPCFGRTTTSTTTTMAPTPVTSNPKWIEWRTLQDKQALANMIRYTDEHLDRLLQLLGSLVYGTFDVKIGVMRKTAVHEVIALTKGVIVNAPSTQRETTDILIKVVFDLLGVIEGAKSDDDLLAIFDMVRESSFVIRFLLPELQVPVYSL